MRETGLILVADSNNNNN